MCRIYGIMTIGIFLVLGTAGCDKFGGADPAAMASTHSTDSDAGAHNGSQAEKSNSPEEAIQAFLEAIRTGNDEKANHMLTAAARQKTAALNRNVTPPASDTAHFAIGKVEYVGQDGAHVSHPRGPISTPTDNREAMKRFGYCDMRPMVGGLPAWRHGSSQANRRCF